MEEPSTTHGVGTGTIEERLIDLPQPWQHAITIDEIAFQKNHRLLKCRGNIQSGFHQGEKMAVDTEMIPALEKRQSEPAHTTQQALEHAVVSCHTDNLAVLVITHDPTLMTFLEAFCMTHDAHVITAALMPEDEDFSPVVELSAFGLIVVDLAVLGNSESCQKRLGCRLLRNWTETDPTLPFLFIGTVSQKRAILAIRADTVRFLTQPINRHELARVIEASGRAKRRRHR